MAKSTITLKSLSKNYLELLRWWAEFRTTFSDVNYSRNVWNNKDIRINSKPVFYKMFIDKGIIFFTDLQFDVDNVRCKLEFSYRAQRVQVSAQAAPFTKKVHGVKWRPCLGGGFVCVKFFFFFCLFVCLFCLFFCFVLFFVFFFATTFMQLYGNYITFTMLTTLQ